jgi:hypothetical protein
MTKKTSFVIPTKEESDSLITQVRKTKKSKLELLVRFFVPQNDKKEHSIVIPREFEGLLTQ